jgi:DNA-binding XRE family transcriptional regulator
MKTAARNTNTYAPVPINPAAEVARQIETSAEFAQAWEDQAEEFEALDELLNARKRAGLTQAQVAELMGVKQSSLARVESSLASRSHAPSLATLRKYAQAVGCKLELRMVPQ